MSNVPNFGINFSRQKILVGAMAISGLAALAWIIVARQYLEVQPTLPQAGFDRLEINPYPVGVGVLSLVVPVALIYLFSRAASLQKAITETAVTPPSLRLIGALVLLQFLALNYELELFFVNPDRVTLGLSVVVVAALLGGWRAGLGLGLVTLLITGTRLMIHNLDVIDFFRDVYEHAAPGEFSFILRDTLLRHYLVNLQASFPVWVGILAGLGAELLGKRRFLPAVAFILGIVVELVAGYPIALASPDPAFFLWLLFPGALVLGIALAVVVLIFRSVQADAARRRAEMAELARTQAELRALRAQINPHFLFNALNTIRFFVRTDAETARRLLLNLSQVFQSALKSGDFVPLRAEIDTVKAYLALEQARLEERLQVTWSFDEDSPLLECLVPTLILQPIVENAVVHGLAPKPGGGALTIRITQEDDHLCLLVEDDGMGMSPQRLAEALDPAADDRQAVGLRNVDGRLRALYGADYCLDIQSEPGSGTRIKIRIPIRPDEEPS
jgi:signal transduction histidine kinase